MTALRIDERDSRAVARLRAVPSSAPRPMGPAVRPDRPSSRKAGLHAVPPQPSVDGTALAVRWSTAPVAPALRSERKRTVDTPARRAHERQAQRQLQRGFSLNNAAMVMLTIAGMVMAFALGVLVFTAMGLGLQAGDAITVVSGDTLWSIAAAMGVDVPTAQVVQDIAELNGLSGYSIVAGTELILPAY